MSYRNCDRCGRFHDHGPGSAWRMIFSGWPRFPDHDISRCRACVEKYGPFEPQEGIKPEYSCGIVKNE
jgi:hypothetical protein